MGKAPCWVLEEGAGTSNGEGTVLEEGAGTSNGEGTVSRPTGRW